MTAAVEPLHHGDIDNLEPPELECPPFWWDNEWPPYWKVPGKTEHELYEARPIPPYPFDKAADIDVTPFVGTYMAWLPRCAPQLIELKADKFNPSSLDDPRRKLDFAGQYNLRNPLPMKFHKSLPDHGWWYATARGVYVYHPYSAAWDLGITQIKDSVVETMAHSGSMFGRPCAIFRRTTTKIPAVEFEFKPTTASVAVGADVDVTLKATLGGEPCSIELLEPVLAVSSTEFCTIKKVVHNAETGEATITVTGVKAGSADLTATVDPDNVGTAKITVTAA